MLFSVLGLLSPLQAFRRILRGLEGMTGLPIRRIASPQNCTKTSILSLFAGAPVPEAAADSARNAAGYSVLEDRLVRLGDDRTDRGGGNPGRMRSNVKPHSPCSPVNGAFHRWVWSFEYRHPERPLSGGPSRRFSRGTGPFMTVRLGSRPQEETRLGNIHQDIQSGRSSFLGI